MSALYSGFLLCIGLIVSIGPQNTEILRIGTLGRPTCLLASVFVLCDAILVTFGAWGLGSLIVLNRSVMLILTIGTAVMLLMLAFRAVQRTRTSSDFDLELNSIVYEGNGLIRRGLLLSFLNPLALLETVVIIGSAAAPHQGTSKMLFIAGALGASVCWFYSLSAVARQASALVSQRWHRNMVEFVAAAVLVFCAVWLILGVTSPLQPGTQHSAPS